MEIVGHYDWSLLCVSVVAAIIASFVAITAVPRVYDKKSGAKRSWAWTGIFGLSFGTGVWTMHFVGILALKIPLTYTFDLSLTVLSLLISVLASSIAILPLRFGGNLSWNDPKTLMSGLMLGLSIVTMHYTGMEAILINAEMTQNKAYVFLATIIAVIASTIALSVANQLRESHVFNQIKLKVIIAVVLGVAISAMHYTAMEGVYFYPSTGWIDLESSIDTIALVVFLISIFLLIQGGVVVTSILDETYLFAKESEEKTRRRANINQALSNILSTGLKKEPLAKKMQTILDIILRLDCLTFKKVGSIFIAQNNKTLEMVASHDMPAVLLKKCKSIAFGECLCGAAAQEKQLIYKTCVDKEHSIGYSGMEEHGHYCIPVVSDDKVLAVINLYVEEGHEQKKEEKQFLSMVADALSVIISRHQVEESAQNVVAAINQAGEAIIISDTTGRIEYVNKAFVNLTGYSEEEALGKRTSLLKSGKQDRAFYQNMWETILSGETWMGEVVQRRKDGTTYPAMLTVAPSKNIDDEITHFIGIHEDRTEHANLEAQFRQAQKMEAIGNLVGGIAHDFNNMLAAITGNTYLAKRYIGDNDKALKKLQNIEQVSMRAADMIQQLLTFSRKDMVNMEKLNLSDLIDESLGFLKNSIPENITLYKLLADDALFVMGDQALLNQVLINLIVNAKDAVVDEDQPVIKVYLEPFVPDMAWLETHTEFEAIIYAHISIVDNGSGIAAQNMGNIFEPFFTTKEQGKGTGLGLSMVFGAVQSHSGVIQVESQPGAGTVVHVYLPVLQNSKIQMVEKFNVEAIRADGELVLVVDDEDTVREMTVEVLEELGYEVLQACDGDAGLDVFHAHEKDIDIAVLDVVMPKMGGVELARIMRETNPHLPVVFMTGYDKDNVLQGYDVLSHSEVLTKPTQPSELSQTMRSLLEIGKNSAEA